MRLALEDPAPAVRAAALGLARGGVALSACPADRGGDDAETRLAARLVLDAEPTRRQDPPAELLRSPVAAVRFAAERARATRLAAGVLASWDTDAPPARATRLAACLAAPGGEAALRARLTPPRRADASTRRRLRSVRRALANASEPRVPLRASSISDPSSSSVSADASLNRVLRLLDGVDREAEAAA